jgi:hypothetical protein
MPIDPLIEVSTVGGRNMRETCARVLAAALMTGAIATVVGMSALFDTPTEVGRPIAAPPSSLQRSVRVEVVAVHRRNRVERIETARPISAPARPVVVTRRLVIVRNHRSRPPRRSLASTQRKAPAPTPAAPSRPVVTPPAGEPATPETVAPATEQDDDNHGHAYGHDKEHKHGHEGHEE